MLGPLASQTLGDMGADVWKVETRAGDPMRGVGPSRHPGMGPYFLSLNRNKRSIVLDLKHPAARPVIERMIARADVLRGNCSAARARAAGDRLRRRAGDQSADHLL